MASLASHTQKQSITEETWNYFSVEMLNKVVMDQGTSEPSFTLLYAR